MTKVSCLKNIKKLSSATEKVLKDFYPRGLKIIVKMHFGEPGNKYAFTPKQVEPIISALKKLGLKPVLFDSVVVYLSPRKFVASHQLMAKKKGFGKLAPILISNTSVPVKTKNFTAGVIKELAEAEAVLVLSHVKGHANSGFGGAIKNLGMGGVDRKTKRAEHELGKPKFIGDCAGCGICAEVCPDKAIKMVKGKAKINLRACYGCSICQLECPQKCLAPKTAIFDDLLAQGAAAVIGKMPKKVFYINFLTNIVKLCDCCSDPGGLVSKDLGVLFSENPVAIDAASLDLINKANKKNLFKETNHKDPFLQVSFAEKYTKWRKKYKLVIA